MATKTLVTGAAGYLGRAMIEPFVGKHDLKLMDVADFDSPHEKFVGSVDDLDTVMKATEGVDAIVIAHMASRANDNYATPTGPFDVNVRGTANLLHAAVEHGIKKISLISSMAVVSWYQSNGYYLTRDMPMRGEGYYPMTKICQETIARQFHLQHGLSIAALRPSYVTDATSKSDKYGRVATEYNWQYIDRRDIGLAAYLAIENSEKIGFEPLFLLGPEFAFDFCEMQPTYDILGWKPQFDFSDMIHRPLKKPTKRHTDDK